MVRSFKRGWSKLFWWFDWYKMRFSPDSVGGKGWEDAAVADKCDTGGSMTQIKTDLLANLSLSSDDSF